MTRKEIEEQFDYSFQRHQWREGEILNMVDFAEQCVKKTKQQLALHNVVGKNEPTFTKEDMMEFAKEYASNIKHLILTSIEDQLTEWINQNKK